MSNSQHRLNDHALHPDDVKYVIESFLGCEEVPVECEENLH